MNKRQEKIKYLEEARMKIEDALEEDNGYSSQVVTFTLRGVAEKLGKHISNDLIDEYGLEPLGWHKEKL